MTKVPSWAWQLCSVHFNSPVMKDRFVLFPLWRRWVFLIFLSRQHWLVCVICASETDWETERMPGALRGCGSHALDFQNQLSDGLQGLAWEAVARKGRKQSKTQWHTLKYVQYSVDMTPLHWTWEKGCCRRHLKEKPLRWTGRNGGKSIISLLKRTIVWLRILTLLLNILYFAPRYL